ncbi:hypothetical protein AMYBAR_001995 [Amycolatopsis bartoniae]|uniref:TIM barrel protein n=1 Tax=Amycolatopsis bartoniae TaxID=941986 RepID=A0A8H9J596_9PSEU|nr:hypothetical protein [Amycolatopsis bartoniae]TVT05270.1 hypothetical protein FNH07_23265 [Amycolatopsis bartoniae]GHF76650.1 hypothetical protein GCM10017566_58460 [Amycolatopsis bartoniae]
MNPRLGISSACAKHLDSEELASLVLSLGGRTVDLRAGRGHRWEQSGLDGFRALGVEVGHVGLSVVLGNPRHDPEKVAKEAARYGGVPLRVFAAEHVAADDQLVAEQVEALTGAAGPVGDVLVDTHQGYASLRQIEELHDRYGVRAVVDLEGLAFLEPSVEKAAARLAAFTQTVHVKGFALRPGSLKTRHRPLGPADRVVLSRAREAFAGVPRVCLQSEAGSVAQDFAVLAEVWTQSGLTAPSGGTPSKGRG